MGKLLVVILPFSFSFIWLCRSWVSVSFLLSLPSRSSRFYLLDYLSVAYNLLMFYQLIKYLAGNNQILILRASSIFKKDQKIFNYWALIPPYLTVLSMESVLNYSISMVRLTDRDEMIILPSTVSAIHQFSEQNQMIEEEMKNYLSTSLPTSFGKPSDYNPNLYSKGLSRSSMLVKTSCAFLCPSCVLLVSFLCPSCVLLVSFLRPSCALRFVCCFFFSR
jgi:hypothetical protein